jgi:hypothetical protein
MASGCSLLQRHCGGSFPWCGCLLCFGLKWWLCKGACHWRSCSLLCPLEYLSGHSLSTSFIGFSSMWRHQVTGESNGLLFCHHRCMMKISLGFSAHSSCLWCDIFMQCNREIFEELSSLSCFQAFNLGLTVQQQLRSHEWTVDCDCNTISDNVGRDQVEYSSLLTSWLPS